MSNCFNTETLTTRPYYSGMHIGKPISLAPEVEEVASFFAALLYTEHAENPVFQQNFFKDFSKLAKKHKTVTIIVTTAVGTRIA